MVLKGGRRQQQWGVLVMTGRGRWRRRKTERKDVKEPKNRKGKKKIQFFDFFVIIWASLDKK